MQKHLGGYSLSRNECNDSRKNLSSFIRTPVSKLNAHIIRVHVMHGMLFYLRVYQRRGDRGLHF